MPAPRAHFARPQSQTRTERAAELLARGVVRHMLARRIESTDSAQNPLDDSGESRLHGPAVHAQRARETAGEQA